MICYALLFLYHTVDQMGQDNRFSILLTIIEVLGLTVIHSLCLPVCQQLKNNNKHQFLASPDLGYPGIDKSSSLPRWSVHSSLFSQLTITALIRLINTTTPSSCVKAFDLHTITKLKCHVS